MLGNPWQVLTDCPFCRTEAAVVELIDPAHPACHLGVAAEQTCRMCGWQTRAGLPEFAARDALEAARCPNCRKPLTDAERESGACPHCAYAPQVEQVEDPAPVRQAAVARARLIRWARVEGEPDAEQFCRANIGLSMAEVVQLYVDGEPVGTSFDVIAFLFPGASGGMGISAARKPEPEVAPEPSRSKAPVAMDPRAPARLLISVMVADGELRAGERQFIEAFLAAEGLDPLDMKDIRVWRPHELGPIPDAALRRKLLEGAVHLMHLDRERDGSEWRVIRSFARAWGVPEDTVRGWDETYDRRYAPAMSRLYRALSSFVRAR